MRYFELLDHRDHRLARVDGTQAEVFSRKSGAWELRNHLAGQVGGGGLWREISAQQAADLERTIRSWPRSRPEELAALELVRASIRYGEPPFDENRAAYEAALERARGDSINQEALIVNLAGLALTFAIELAGELADEEGAIDDILDSASPVLFWGDSDAPS